jgi:hypothetical protein
MMGYQPEILPVKMAIWPIGKNLLLVGVLLPERSSSKEMRSFMSIKNLFLMVVIVSTALAACAPGPVEQNTPTETDNPEGDQALPESATAPPVIDEGTDPSDEPAAEPESQAPESEPESKNESPPRGAESQFSTDFSIHSVPYDEILSGGPPKDGIPSIDNPKFVSINEADEWIEDVEPIIQVERNGKVKGYPLQILTWHEIVNDRVGDTPVVVTFCPLCNTAIAFERRVGGKVLDFGTTGRLRFSNLIMYDRQTETWWQQATGEAIVGELTGTQLQFIPAPLVSWAEFKDANPGAAILSRETGYMRSYGENPYPGYDDIDQPPFLYDGPLTPETLPAVARILAVEIENEAVAYPYEVLSDVKTVNDRVGEEDIVIFWTPGTASALDDRNISEGEDVGSAAAYSREVDEKILTFRPEGVNFIDDETGSTWDIQGLAVEGALAGERLEEVVGMNHFWFSWAAFKPDTRIYQPEN